MTNPTDSDRATAERVIDELLGSIDRWDGDPQAFVVAGNTIAAALASEREACETIAKTARASWFAGEASTRYGQGYQAACDAIAAAIRARSADQEKQP